MGRSRRTRLFARIGLVFAGLALIVWAVQRADVIRVFAVLQSLTAEKILLLLLVNVIVEISLAGRWWLFLAHLGYRIRYRFLTLYKVAAIAISYVTPGPQFGGEPFQVFVLKKRHGVAVAPAVSSLLLDRLVEMIIHSAFLIVVLFLLSTKTAGINPLSLFFVGAMFFMPVAIMIMYYHGGHPFLPIARLSGRWPRSEWLSSLALKIEKTDNLASQTVTGARGLLLRSLTVSLLNWIGLASEFWLLYHFLGLTLNPYQLAVTLGASRIAFLLPIPAGLGTLEASQVFALNILGLDSSTGISACLIIRARDLLMVATGLIVAKTYLLSSKEL